MKKILLASAFALAASVSAANATTWSWYGSKTYSSWTSFSSYSWSSSHKQKRYPSYSWKYKKSYFDDCDDDDKDHGGDTPEVPLPAAGWLLIAGLGGLAAMRRRSN